MTLVLALPGGELLGGSLAARLQCECRPLAVHRFPDGETLVRIDAQVTGRTVVLAGSLDQPDAKTLPLIFAADAARELGAARVGLVAPYLGYLRQDARFAPGEAITSRSYARLLSGSLDFLLTVDPHLHRWRSLDQIYGIRTRVVAAAPAIAAWLREHVPQALIVGPDAESEQWVAEVARRAGTPWTVMHKVRHGDTDVTVELPRDLPDPGRTPVLLDDILSTGHTLAAAARELSGAGWPAPIAIAVHALFTHRALERLQTTGITRVVTCDTVVHPTNAIPLAAALADALQNLIDGKRQEHPAHPGPP